MSETEVKKIYNRLSKIESKINASTAYPIHKRLNFGKTSSFKDVYDWIFSTIAIPQKGKMLDVGCGVGYGSFYLCERTDCESLGISLSEREVAIATAIAKQKKWEKRCQFQVQSFDKPLVESYDLIIAVESIKHSMQLPHSLRNLFSALKPNGRMFIVEDFFLEKEDNKDIDYLIQDWKLKATYTLADYKNILKQNRSLSFKLHDLSPFVIHKKKWQLGLHYFGANCLSRLLKATSRGGLFQIMRGGYALEELYQRGEVKYQILEIWKE